MCGCGKGDGPCAVHADEMEAALDQVMRERDDAHELLDTFAYTIAPLLAIGEHSSMNDPWRNALDLVVPVAHVDRLEAALQRCADSLQSFIDEHPDPGAEAYGAVYEANILLRRVG